MFSRKDFKKARYFEEIEENNRPYAIFPGDIAYAQTSSANAINADDISYAETSLEEYD